MNHYFELKSKDSSKESSIRYRCHFNGIRFIYGTGVKIYLELWDSINQKPVKNKILIKEYKKQIPNIEVLLANIEIRINNIKTEVEGYLSNCKFNNLPILESDLKLHLDTTIRRSDKTKKKVIPVIKKKGIDGEKMDLFIISDYLSHFIYGIQNGTRTISTGKSKGNRYTHGTIKNYFGLLEQWKRFEKAKKKKYTWLDISIPFYEEFLIYCNNSKLSKNFTGRLIKQLKVIAQAAMDEGIHTNNIFRDKRFETLSETAMNIALTEKELDNLYNLNFSEKSNSDIIRDLFLVGCYTAQRWSDFSKINQNHIQSNMINLIQQKTKERVIIPIKPRLKTILDKYPNGFPKISDQAFNRKIKEIAEAANIIGTIQIKETIGGISRIKEYQKYQLISSHTARRTAATIMYTEGIPTLAIMKLTGHKTESSFMKYIKISEEENASLIEKHPYFSK